MTDLNHLVSCIMPTFNRRRFVPQAMRCFLLQDYPQRELLILDDGDESVADLMPKDPRIRYFRLERRTVLGEKRNLACEQARGEIIAHWDDDDWMAPWRLSYQVKNLIEHGAELCGIDHLLFYQPSTDRAWKYFYSKGARSWIAGGTLCYTSALWRRRPFPGVGIGEDTQFVWGNNSGKVLALQDNSFYVAIIHSRNSSPKRTSSASYQPYPVFEIRKLLGKECAFYDRLGAGSNVFVGGRSGEAVPMS
jgi:glycosyltransferase involved in cell wall biosynthesis